VGPRATGIIAPVWSREAIAARVEALGEEHKGAALIDAIRRFGDQLDDEERRLLGEVLLDRAREERPSLADVRRRGWLARRFERFERGERR
jgi:hypothetical protein